MRGQGRIFRPKVAGTTTAVWWLDYYVRGKRHRESSHTTSQREALRQLRERTTAREQGKLVGRPELVTFAALQALVREAYTLAGNRSLVRLDQALVHLAAFFGADRAPDITTGRLAAYATARLAAKAARASVNYELACLRRALRLAVKRGLLTTLPVFDLPKVHNTRTGFFTAGDLAALVLELPPVLRPLVRFLYLTGWRRGEALGLTWDAVDWEGFCIRLDGTQTKSGEPRVFPFRLAPDLKALLEAQWAAQDGRFVFHDRGAPIGVGKLRSGWSRATKRAGLDGRLVHDLRRSAARDMRRAGLAESDIMALCGWETREMFARYCIRDEAALEQAAGKRYATDKGQAKPEAAEAPRDSLTSTATP